MCDDPRDKYFNVYLSPMGVEFKVRHINSITISDKYLYHDLYEVINTSDRNDDSNEQDNQ